MAKELSENEKWLLQHCAVTMAKELGIEKELVHLQQSAYNMWNEESEEEFQVQVIVTRCKDDFIESFTTVSMSNYKG